MLDIDTAIKHCLEVAEKNECKMTSDDGCTDVSMKQCAAEHRQLAEWLAELKELKNSIGAAKLELLKEAQAELEKRGNMLHDAIAELEEAKRLLRLAIEDINAAEACDTCEYYPVINSDMCQIDDCYKWRYADEALKLLKED